MSFVPVLQPADLGQRHDAPHWLRLDRSRLGRVLPQREMGSRSVIVIQIRTKDTTDERFRGTPAHGPGTRAESNQ